MVVNQNLRKYQDLKRPSSVYRGFTVPWILNLNTWFGRAYFVQRVLFTIGKFSFGLARITPAENWLSNEAIDYISLYYNVKLGKFDEDGSLIESSYRDWVRGECLEDSGYYSGLSFLTIQTPEGNYVGEPGWALQLIKRGIFNPEPANPRSKTCAIGWSDKHKKYYGWSHRAINGYSVGETIKPNDLATTSGWKEEYLQERPELDKRVPAGMELKTVMDCKAAAIAYASAIG